MIRALEGANVTASRMGMSSAFTVSFTFPLLDFLLPPDAWDVAAAATPNVCK